MKKFFIKAIITRSNTNVNTIQQTFAQKYGAVMVFPHIPSKHNQKAENALWVAPIEGFLLLLWVYAYLMFASFSFIARSTTCLNRSSLRTLSNHSQPEVTVKSWYN